MQLELNINTALNIKSKENFPINNQNGNITLFSLLILLIIAFISMTTISHKLTHMKNLNLTLKNYLCMKELTGEIKRHTEVLEFGNKAIHLANIGQVSGIFTGGSTTIAANRLKKLVTQGQNIYHFSYLKNLSTIIAKGCKFSIGAFKTNFRNKALYKLERNSLGIVRQRNKRWKVQTYSKVNTLEANYNKKNLEVRDRSLISMAKDILSQLPSSF